MFSVQISNSFPVVFSTVGGHNFIAAFAASMSAGNISVVGSGSEIPVALPPLTKNIDAANAAMKL